MSIELGEVLDLLMRIGSGEEGARAEPRSQDEDVAALVVGLNMLSEELDHARGMRAEAERSLTDAREAYDLTPALLCSVDARTLRIVRVNDTFVRAVGVERDALLGRDIVSMFVERDRAVAERALRDVAAGARDTIPELTLDRRGGIQVTTTASLSDDQTRIRIVCSDVTRERQLESQLLQAQKMQAVGRLAGGIAHDFNNLLAVILTSTSFARTAAPHGSRVVEDLATIEQAAQRAAALTSQLLAFSRQQVIRPQQVEVGLLVRDTERMLRRLIDESIELTVVVRDGPLSVVIDPSQLTQVLINLVVNARDAVDGRGRILIEASRVVHDETYAATQLHATPGPYVLLAVSDDGVGMSPDVLGQIFEPFFTTKDAGHGVGLGLSVCYGVVQQASGYIVACSEPGEGTTMKVYLPQVGEAAAIVADEAGPSPGGHESLVLVEDEPSLRRLMTRVLEDTGYHVVAFANGAEALEHVTAQDAPVDLLITDVVMPQMDGHELATQLRERERIRAVLYVSGYTSTGIVRHGVLPEDTAFLSKPFTLDQLLRAVREALRP